MLSEQLSPWPSVICSFNMEIFYYFRFPPLPNGLAQRQRRGRRDTSHSRVISGKPRLRGAAEPLSDWSRYWAHIRKCPRLPKTRFYALKRLLTMSFEGGVRSVRFSIIERIFASREDVFDKSISPFRTKARILSRSLLHLFRSSPNFKSLHFSTSLHKPL